MSVSRREFLNSSSLAFAGAAFWRVPVVGQAPPPAGQPAAPAVTKFEDVRRNVGIFTARGGTIGWFVVADGALAVDAQFPTPRRRASTASRRNRPRASTC